MNKTQHPQSTTPAPRQATHTPEPWTIDANNYGTPWNIDGPNDEKVALCVEGIGGKAEDRNARRRANAERIVSCVNALQNVKNPAAVKQVIQAAKFLVSTWGFNLVPPHDYKQDLEKALRALDSPVPKTKDLGSETLDAQDVTTRGD